MTRADSLPDLSILMPAYNERATVERAVERVLETAFPVAHVELIVVDDGSTDGTRELLAGRVWPDRVAVLHHTRNQGKGAAVRTALGHARGTYTAILDADLEYDPADIARLLEPLIAGDAQVVFGPRGFEAHSAYGFWYVVGNKIVTLVTNLLYNSWLADIMTCQKVMRTDLLRALPLRASGFTIEPEITARLLAAGHRIYEVPVTYRARGRQEGKKLTGLDGLRVVWTLLRCRVDRGGAQSGRRMRG